MFLIVIVRFIGSKDHKCLTLKIDIRNDDFLSRHRPYKALKFEGLIVWQFFDSGGRSELV